MSEDVSETKGPPSLLTDLRIGTTIAIALLIVGLVLRGVFMVATRSDGPTFEGDEFQYHSIAVSGLAGEGWKTQQGYQSYRPPLLPVLMAGVYAIVGPEPAAARWLIVLFSALTAPLLFLVGPRWFGLRPFTALLVALWWTIYPTSIYYGALIFTESVAVFGVVLAAGFYLQAAREQSLRGAVLTGLVWGLVALTRPNLVFLSIFAVAIGTLGRSILGKRSFSPAQAAAAFAIFIIVLAPWTIRNYRIHGIFIPATTMVGIMMPMCNADPDDPRIQAGGYGLNPVAEAIYELPEREWQKAGIELTKAALAERWPELFVPVMNRALNFWSFRPDPFEPRLTTNDIVLAVFWLPVLAFFLVSLIRCSWLDHWHVLLIIAYTFGMTLPFWGSARFRYPVDALILIQAALAFESFGWRLVPKRVSSWSS
jgi:4-amino-4-deoxy-L-arabinose transferase-like glycosyltransferase